MFTDLASNFKADVNPTAKSVTVSVATPLAQTDLSQSFVSLALVVTDLVTELSATAGLVIEIEGMDNRPVISPSFITASYDIESKSFVGEIVFTITGTNSSTASMIGGNYYYIYIYIYLLKFEFLSFVTLIFFKKS